jgi:hypothetical protein
VLDDQQKHNRSRGPLIALAVIVLVLLAAIVLIRELSTAERLQNCLLSGRTNCAPIRTPERYGERT